MNHKKNKVDTNKIAIQALKEAEKRNLKNINNKKMPKELGGPSELEPTRYGDWERNGITSDFWVFPWN